MKINDHNINKIFKLMGHPYLNSGNIGNYVCLVINTQAKQSIALPFWRRFAFEVSEDARRNKR